MTRGGRLRLGRLETGMDRVTHRYFARTADLSTTLLRSSGRDDKGEGGSSIECGCRTEPIFHHPGWGRRPMNSPVDMTILLSLHELQPAKLAPRQNCHPDRSAAQWRDLRFVHPRPLQRAATTLPVVISTGAKRSGEICGLAVVSWKGFSTERERPAS
jgi:hypothetical protein